MCSDRQNHTRMKIAVHAVTNAYSGNLWLYVNVRRFPVNGVAQYCRDELYRRSVFVNITYELPINRLLYRRIIEIQRCGRGLLSSLFLLCREISNCAFNIASQPMIHVEDAFEIFHRYPLNGNPVERAMKFSASKPWMSFGSTMPTSRTPSTTERGASR